MHWTFINNFIIGAGTGFALIKSWGYYSDVKVIHNTFYGIPNLGVQLSSGAQLEELVVNNEISNN